MKLTLKPFLLSLLIPSMASAAVVSGRVTDENGTPVGSVGISDGIQIVNTAPDGTYSLTTDKPLGLVFMITPSGYEPARQLVNRPKFWQQLNAARERNERADFTLRRTDDSRLTFLTLADIQMGGRIDDVTVFNNKTIPDINATIDSLRSAGRQPMAITLGDESWDLYWHENNFALPELISEMEKINCPVYNVIGNHDHDPYLQGDFQAETTWRRLMGPNYYSFNRGGVHFVMLDDIVYINEGTEPGKPGKRNYDGAIAPDQFQWLKADLARISPETPVVVSLHIPLFKPKGTFHLQNGKELAALLAPFKTVNVLSGHTHRSYGVQHGNIRENNYGAICGTWWWTDLPDYGNNSLCVDGTPSGYSVWDVDPSTASISGRYKSVGFPIDYQFRMFDGNTLPEPQKNAILVNVWGWAPGWQIAIEEKGRPLPVEQITFADPLHTISCAEPQARHGKKKPTEAKPTPHFFRAIARKPLTPVTVKVTDPTGRTYTRTLTRPLPLTTTLH